MLDLEKLNNLVSLIVDRVIRDAKEPDKIRINIESIVHEAVVQHAKAIEELKFQSGLWEQAASQAAVEIQRLKDEIKVETSKIPRICRANTICRNGYKDCEPGEYCIKGCPNYNIGGKE